MGKGGDDGSSNMSESSSSSGAPDTSEGAFGVNDENQQPQVAPHSPMNKIQNWRESWSRSIKHLGMLLSEEELPPPPPIGGDPAADDGPLSPRAAAPPRVMTARQVSELLLDGLNEERLVADYSGWKSREKAAKKKEGQQQHRGKLDAFFSRNERRSRRGNIGEGDDQEEEVEGRTVYTAPAAVRNGKNDNQQNNGGRSRSNPRPRLDQLHQHLSQRLQTSVQNIMATMPNEQVDERHSLRETMKRNRNHDECLNARAKSEGNLIRSEEGVVERRPKMERGQSALSVSVKNLMDSMEGERMDERLSLVGKRGRSVRWRDADEGKKSIRWGNSGTDDDKDNRATTSSSGGGGGDNDETNNKSGSDLDSFFAMNEQLRSRWRDGDEEDENFADAVEEEEVKTVATAPAALKSNEKDTAGADRRSQFSGFKSLSSKLAFEMAREAQQQESTTEVARAAQSMRNLGSGSTPRLGETNKASKSNNDLLKEKSNKSSGKDSNNTNDDDPTERRGLRGMLRRGPSARLGGSTRSLSEHFGRKKRNNNGSANKTADDGSSYSSSSSSSKQDNGSVSSAPTILSPKQVTDGVASHIESVQWHGHHTTTTTTTITASSGSSGGGVMRNSGTSSVSSQVLNVVEEEEGD